MSETLPIVISGISLSLTLILLGVIVADRRWRATIAKIFEQQQIANKELMAANAKLAQQVTEIQKKLDVVTAELGEVRRQLEVMTERAMVAEEKAD